MGMRPTLGAAAAAGFTVAIALAGCGSAPVARTSSSPVAQVSVSPAAATSASPMATPASATPSAAPAPSAAPCQTFYPLPDLCVGVIGRVPTQQEYADMTAAALPPVEKALGYKDWSVCSTGQNCFKASGASSAMMGTNAGVFDAGYGLYPEGGLGAACWVFVYKDSSGWHLLNFGCAQNAGFVPGSADTGSHVFVSGCANYRVSPSLAAKVLDCLANGTVINVDSAPVYQDGHVWWHLTDRGWMAHDYLCEICRV